MEPVLFSAREGAAEADAAPAAQVAAPGRATVLSGLTEINNAQSPVRETDSDVLSAIDCIEQFDSGIIRAAMKQSIPHCNKHIMRNSLFC